MCTANEKLVKSFILISFLLLTEETLQVKGIRGESNEEESDAPVGHIVYDQRQTGKYNIHVVIKDVAIIEMGQNEIADQNYNDEEYYYDEDDLTIKPLIIKSTTTTTTTTTSQPTNGHIINTTTKPTISISQITTETSTTNYTVLTTIETGPTKEPPLTTTINTPTTTSEDIKVHEVNTNLPALDIKPRSKVEPIYAIEEPIDIKPRSKVEPIYAAEEPILKTRHHLQEVNYPSESREGSSFMSTEHGKKFKNSRIYKVKVHRSQIVPQVVRCRINQYRDSRGNCRRRRDSLSGSIL